VIDVIEWEAYDVLETVKKKIVDKLETLVVGSLDEFLDTLLAGGVQGKYHKMPVAPKRRRRPIPEPWEVFKQGITPDPNARPKSRISLSINISASVDRSADGSSENSGSCGAERGDDDGDDDEEEDLDMLAFEAILKEEKSGGGGGESGGGAVIDPDELKSLPSGYTIVLWEITGNQYGGEGKMPEGFMSFN
jgi:hypothetical protein